ncbi:MAG: hypothetical protein J1F36_01780, partial [Clostridiales bacterium]|nr:hypothetical protein [Clostridiales bacterium]
SFDVKNIMIAQLQEDKTYGDTITFTKQATTEPEPEYPEGDLTLADCVGTYKGFETNGIVKVTATGITWNDKAITIESQKSFIMPGEFGSVMTLLDITTTIDGVHYKFEFITDDLSDDIRVHIFNMDNYDEVWEMYEVIDVFEKIEETVEPEEPVEIPYDGNLTLDDCVGTYAFNDNTIEVTLSTKFGNMVLKPNTITYNGEAATINSQKVVVMSGGGAIIVFLDVTVTVGDVEYLLAFRTDTLLEKIRIYVYNNDVLDPWGDPSYVGLFTKVEPISFSDYVGTYVADGYDDVVVEADKITWGDVELVPDELLPEEFNNSYPLVFYADWGDKYVKVLFSANKVTFRGWNKETKKYDTSVLEGKYYIDFTLKQEGPIDVDYTGYEGEYKVNPERYPALADVVITVTEDSLSWNGTVLAVDKQGDSQTSWPVIVYAHVNDVYYQFKFNLTGDTIMVYVLNDDGTTTGTSYTFIKQVVTEPVEIDFSEVVGKYESVNDGSIIEVTEDGITWEGHKIESIARNDDYLSLLGISALVDGKEYTFTFEWARLEQCVIIYVGPTNSDQYDIFFPANEEEPGDEVLTLADCEGTYKTNDETIKVTDGIITYNGKVATIKSQNSFLVPGDMGPDMLILDVKATVDGVEYLFEFMTDVTGEEVRLFLKDADGKLIDLFKKTEEVEDPTVSVDLTKYKGKYANKKNAGDVIVIDENSMTWDGHQLKILGEYADTWAEFGLIIMLDGTECYVEFYEESKTGNYYFDIFNDSYSVDYSFIKAEEPGDDEMTLADFARTYTSSTYGDLVVTASSITWKGVAMEIKGSKYEEREVLNGFGKIDIYKVLTVEVTSGANDYTIEFYLYPSNSTRVNIYNGIGDELDKSDWIGYYTYYPDED